LAAKKEIRKTVLSETLILLDYYIIVSRETLTKSPKLGLNNFYLILAYQDLIVFVVL
jgi:hypothetical protein